jgi:RNA polymerase sigma-70 factor (ECF subfamily)
MREARTGRVEAFAQIYDRHAPIVLAVARRMLASAGEAHDLLHDVFLEAWQQVRQYDAQKASVRTWLLVRVRSRALDRLGRRAREERAHRTLSPRGSEVGADPSTLHAERHLALRQALVALDESVRGTLELTYFEGLTAAEIAQRMSVPEGTVKSRLARGLSQLLGELSGESHEG